ncbi:MAG: glycosyltransferase [Deltaproteobacteria bacterium]|nr:glycosyltransferase [Deltaproteobacteria bacterium]
MEKIRVLAVIPDGGNKVSMIFAHRQMNYLKESSIDVGFFMLKSRTSLKMLFSDMIAFRQKIAMFKPDVVHAHYGTVTSFFCALGAKKPLVITFRGSDLNPVTSENAFRKGLKQVLSQLSTLRAKHIICVSQGLKKRLWWRNDEVSIIPSGIDLSIFKPLPIKYARERLGLSLTDRIILFNVGKSPLVKRLDLAEQSLKFVNSHFPNTCLVKLYENIDPDDMPFYYNAADCLLLTSDHEGSPNVVKEAISCNCPVVSVDVGDVRERLAGVWPSKIVKRDPAEIGRAINEIFKLNRRSNGHNKIHEISLDRLCTEIVNIYHSML